ncbi:MAG TPA: ribosome small subunit-dependent GTPase A [Spirochaetia bacterium]|nr:ribosome small subunit-dependent GTPase A [Spirochaetia bacterium]
MKGQIRAGINNIYTVRVDGRDIECRIKGKVLGGKETFSNPIAVGDYVTIALDPYSPKRGNILSLEPRANALTRFSKKKKRIQTIASNVDFLLIVSSVGEPPFRPRFIDRMLVAAAIGGVTPLVVLNKCDLGIKDEVRRRLDEFRRLSYQVLVVSATTGGGLDALKKILTQRTAALAGQSGVGKTSLLNALEPGLGLKVGKVSAKYGRGAHTTSYASMITIQGGKLTVIDTPGIRELDIADLEPEALRFYFPEFTAVASACAYPSCLHDREPECAVKRAVEAKEILDDRYESYLRILADLAERKRSAYE